MRCRLGASILFLWIKFERFIPILGLGRELGEMMAFMDEFGYAGGDPDVVLPSEVGGTIQSITENLLTQDSLEFIVRSPAWEEWIKKQDWLQVLSS